MKKSLTPFLFVLFILLMFSNPLFSQENNPFDFYVDMSRFRYDANNSYLEIYYTFAQNKFKLIKQNEVFNGSAIFSFRIYDKKTDTLVAIARWRAPFVINDTSVMSSEKALTGIKSFAIPFGEFYMIAKITDENDKLHSDSLRFEFRCQANQPGNPAISDPELCISIQQIPKDDKNIFYKNTLEVIPNPRMIFGIGLPILYVYTELYQLNNLKSEVYNFNVDVFDINAKKVRSMPKQKKKQHESSVEVSTVNCSDLPSGTYILRCSVIDEKDTSIKAFSFKKFFIFNPQIEQPKEIEKGAELISSEYALMDESDIDREFQIAKYLANKEEIEQYEKITALDGKRTFMADFWKKRDSDPQTPENETKDRFTKAIKHVNANYRTGQREGWKTDRGRIFIMYGIPDEFERHPNEIDAKPYEIWYYNNLEGGVIFVFVDKSTMGDYTLVHSTYRNELRDDNWQRLLK